MSAKIIDGKAIAERVRREAAEEVDNLVSAGGSPPGLAVVLVGDDPASGTYVAGKEKACEEAGIMTETRQLPDDVAEAELLGLVRELNEDPRFHGILVQLPLPGHVDSDNVLHAIDPLKDVDGLHPFNLGLLFGGAPRFVPATPAGILRILSEEGIETSGSHVVICGRSNIVGRPLAGLLLGRGPGGNATVTVCHSRTADLACHTRQADILVAAMGAPESITADMVRPGAVAIDVGTSRVEDPTRKRGWRLAGDLANDVREVAAKVTPVPGGVGPMTIAMLLKNVVQGARLARGS
ncbi:MAG: bifunctional 5,10-methylenetetrahydrofolate dehydrogenase/5,10-methenyltetrahydrofolate cyclohydrolase [Chloroflexota bacterium]